MNSASFNFVVVLLCFWFLMAIFSNMFDVTLTKSDISLYKPNSPGQDLQKDSVYDAMVKGGLRGILFDQVMELPVLRAFKPLLMIMSFQYSDNIPMLMSIFLDLMAVVTGMAVYEMVRG